MAFPSLLDIAQWHNTFQVQTASLRMLDSTLEYVWLTTRSPSKITPLNWHLTPLTRGKMLPVIYVLETLKPHPYAVICNLSERKQEIIHL